MGALAEWGTGIMFSLLFLGVFTGIIVEMNGSYHQSNVVGLVDNSNGTNRFITYMDKGSQKVTGGEVSLDATNGITLKTSYQLVEDFIGLVWDFVSGGWIGDVIDMLNLGTMGTLLSVTLRILFFISIIFALIYILFKVNP